MAKGPIFTTRHYRAVAELLGTLDGETRATTYETHGEWQSAMNAIADVTENFAVMFEHDNPLFKRELFMDAVGGRILASVG